MLKGYMGKVLRVNLTTRSVAGRDDSREGLRDAAGRQRHRGEILLQRDPRRHRSAGRGEQDLLHDRSPHGHAARVHDEVPARDQEPRDAHVPLLELRRRLRAAPEAGGLRRAFHRGQGRGLDLPLPHRRQGELRRRPALEGLLLREDPRGACTRRRERRRSGAMSIGPAGENLVRFSYINVDERAFGRGGPGAVMGSKLLKGIIVKGTGEIPLANKERVDEIRKARDQGAEGIARQPHEVRHAPVHRGDQRAGLHAHAETSRPASSRTATRSTPT